jgi:hypothetical protein
LLYAVRYGYRKGPRDRVYGQVTSPWLTVAVFYRSDDAGRTWSKPAVFYPYGVWPQLARLANEVVVLSFGRPGVDLLFSANVHGHVWEHPIHVPEVSGTCSYTGLLAVAPDRCLLVYSRWPFKNAEGGAGKAIILREIRVTRLPVATP